MDPRLLTRPPWTDTSAFITPGPPVRNACTATSLSTTELAFSLISEPSIRWTSLSTVQSAAEHSHQVPHLPHFRVKMPKNCYPKNLFQTIFWVVGWMRMIHFSGFKLRMHIATFHLNMKPFRCTLCNSSFPKSSNLCYHIGTRYYSLWNHFLLLYVTSGRQLYYLIFSFKYSSCKAICIVMHIFPKGPVTSLLNDFRLNGTQFWTPYSDTAVNNWPV